MLIKITYVIHTFSLIRFFVVNSIYFISITKVKLRVLQGNRYFSKYTEYEENEIL